MKSDNRIVLESNVFIEIGDFFGDPSDIFLGDLVATLELKDPHTMTFFQLGLDRIVSPWATRSGLDSAGALDSREMRRSQVQHILMIQI